MSKFKRGTSIISLVLCAVIITLVTTALVVATNNAGRIRAEQVRNRQNAIVETTAYTKVYSTYEVESIARQAYVNNYLSLYDQEVDFDGFKALVIGEMMQIIPAEQLENYNIHITYEGVSVERI